MTGAFQTLYPDGYEGNKEALERLEKARRYCEYVGELLISQTEEIQTPDLAYCGLLYKYTDLQNQIHVRSSYAINAPVPQVLIVQRDGCLVEWQSA
jgi:hypothetical protein